MLVWEHRLGMNERQGQRGMVEVVVCMVGELLTLENLKQKRMISFENVEISCLQRKHAAGNKLLQKMLEKFHPHHNMPAVRKVQRLPPKSHVLIRSTLLFYNFTSFDRLLLY